MFLSQLQPYHDKTSRNFQANVETSSDDAQMGARKFYKKIGYVQMAVIKDFWNDGEDKIVFWKRL